MPHIYIREEDKTRANVTESTNVVYIPGLIDDGGTLAEKTPTRFESVNAFVKAITGDALTPISQSNVNALMAKQLISLGLPVLFESFGFSTALACKAAAATEPFSAETTYYTREASTAGAGYLNDGSYAYTIVAEPVEESLSEYFIIKVEGHNGKTAEEIKALIDWKKLSDKGLYDVKFLTAGAVSTLDIAKTMIKKCASKRGDCIALIDHEQVITPDVGKTIADKVHDLFEVLVNGDEALSPAEVKYAAAFSPWCEFVLDGEKHVLPGSFAFLSSYGQSTKNNPNWYAAAGSTRGQIPALSSSGPVYKYGDADCLVLQGREDIAEDGSFETNGTQTFAVNPISNIRPFGYIVWGNRTLLDNTEDGLTASSFLNIRNLCCDIKKALYAAARKYTFEQNTDILWVNFCAAVTPLLDRALTGNGIRGYRMIQLPSGVKARLKAVVRIVPIEAVEDFDLTLELTDTLEEVSESV